MTVLIKYVFVGVGKGGNVAGSLIKSIDQAAVVVRDIDEVIEEMEGKGYPLLQSGRGMGTEGDAAHAYFDTGDALGCIMEAIEMPGEMPDPERTFPE